ncbi:MAG: NAD(P)-dependent oxidoreductase [Rhodospirillaceae bacterium]|jgi:3-hydroxyisobutyrate dehydrogenase-like beta-hydroxyacid dehydrogenase|nr:NAD(P)-dependent oxidoreductase [Rhodospirillaceae bacterium]MBT3931981.1 NAD(P)-dependent oxidoreductase [Rhodospirillaceae bacterium]MBT4771086.1 NAD(P)-dependent oxidoreductase [Rhodospirillaceae bacterium]MBT5357711.1 NAD(P)-dependent oxidoreductase [Rhodospirillaceae bacterium]MBT5768857.1 NAD(P)-dependent oxidoreductase [Rhodospirillaceae bacterium]
MALRVGVIGLGIMGGAFAANLVKAGFQVTGYDPVKSKLNALVKAGGKAGKSAADVARKSDVVITSLTSPAILDAVVSGKDGILAGARKGMILIETSTLDIADKTRVQSALAKKGASMMDCPVSGAGQQAASGQITIMASGTKTDFNKVRSVFEAFTMIQYHVGPFGNGMKLKLLINMLISVHGAAFAEAITLARLSGIDLDVFADVLTRSAGNSRVIEYRGPLMLADDYNNPKTKTADLTVMIKDNNLIEQYAKDFSAPVPVFQASMFTTYAALAQGLGQEDPGVVTRVYEQMAGIPRKKRAPAKRKKK